MSRRFFSSLAFHLCLPFFLSFALFGVGLGASSARAAEWMYVSQNDNTIVRYDISLASGIDVKNSMSVFVSGLGLNVPEGLAFDTVGNLYVANSGNHTITRYDSEGNYGGTPFVPAGQGLSVPVGLAFDISGNLYATNNVGSTITRYDSEGNRIGTNFATSDQGLFIPYGLSFDSAGNLYAANTGGTITRYDSEGNYGGAPFVSGNGLNSPRGLAFDSVGNLYAANRGSQTITKYDADGNYGGTPFVSGEGLNFPHGLAFDSVGNLYVASWGNTMSKYDSTGAFLFSWTTPAQPRFLAFPTSVVPEPSTYVLGGLAAGAMALIARRRKMNSKG